MMTIEEQKKIITELQSLGIEGIDDYTPFPEPYCENPKNVKAIYLGCDPSNKFKARFEYAFALPKGEDLKIDPNDGDPTLLKKAIKGFRGFVTSHTNNLRKAGLSWDDLYVQNLCQNYFLNESSKNPIWDDAANIWIQILIKELKQFNSDIPVLMTSELIYKVLLNDSLEPRPAESFYKCEKHDNPFVDADYNQLGRTLIPFYRHPKYRLKNYPGYASTIDKYLNHTRI